MIEILKNELRIDEKVLKYATDEEIQRLRTITAQIIKRIRVSEEEMAAAAAAAAVQKG